MTVIFSACSGEQVAHDITKVQITMSGNRPPTSFKVANLQTMKDYVFNMNDYTIAMPTAREIDFKKHTGWKGLTHYNKDMTLYLEGFYHISVSTSGNTLKYGERDRAIETRDKTYIRYVRKHYKYPQSTKLYYGVYGKENYACIVKERVDEFNRYKIAYSCYKFNPKRTKSKHVTVILTYNKPKDPKLAKEYTYADLKRRAGRMLDSLYIKEGW
ncbi:MAG: hypothetical protein RBQ96_06655 [Candidatus Methanomethylophilaceae archaeon]|jgi:hypothetical protein|nr:hypothetical protein [Candidatus Methanomethylophilaceae archaeon]